MPAAIRIGTCSWADDALSKHWYPPGTPPRERLAYYAERFSTVEVDSTYYRVPTEQMVRGWAERTPDGLRDAREGIRAHDAPPREARAGAARPARRAARGFARAGRPPAARGARRRVPRVPWRTRAVARGREARRAPLPDAAVRRLETVVARLPRVGKRPARRRPDAVRATTPIVVRRDDPRRVAALARGARDRLGRGRCSEGRGRQRARDARRDHVPGLLRSLPRTQRSHVERARRVGGAALRPSLRRGRVA